MSYCIDSAQDVEALSPGRSSDEPTHKTPDTCKKRTQDKVRSIDEIDFSVPCLSLLKPGLHFFFFELLLRLNVCLCGNAAHFSMLCSKPLDLGPHRRWFQGNPNIFIYYGTNLLYR